MLEKERAEREANSGEGYIYIQYTIVQREMGNDYIYIYIRARVKKMRPVFLFTSTILTFKTSKCFQRYIFLWSLIIIDVCNFYIVFFFFWLLFGLKSEEISL